MLAFSNDYYGFIFRATQSVELFCAYSGDDITSDIVTKNSIGMLDLSLLPEENAVFQNFSL